MSLESYVAVLLFAASFPLWLAIYVKFLLPAIRRDNIGALERGEIELNPDWFDSIITEIVKRTRHLFLADLGNLARAPYNGGEDISAPEDVLGGGAGLGAGLEMAEQLLKAVGMKKPPSMLVIKTAQALGKMAENMDTGDGDPPPPSFPEFGT